MPLGGRTLAATGRPGTESGEVFIRTLLQLWPAVVVAGAAILYFGRKRLSGRLRIFVMMIGGSILGFFVSVLLHNAIYALVFVTLMDRPDLDEPVFFIIAVLVCPVALAVGIVGSLVTWRKQRRPPQAG